MALHLDRRADELAAAAVVAAYPDDFLLTVKDVACWLGVHEITVMRWRRQGFGPKAISVGLQKIRFKKADVKAWLEKRAAVAANAGA